MKKISVILPAYNCEAYITQTLDMIRLQSFPQSDIEVIVYLDGCTDTTPNIVDTYAKTHSDMNLTIVKNIQNNGVSVARNTAIKYAQGLYIHFIDSDDFINTDFYQNMYQSAIQADADIAVASYINERWPHDSVIFDKEIVLSRAQDKLDMTRADQLGYSWRYLIRWQFWQENHLEFPQNLKYCEDMYPIVRCVCLSNRLVTVPNATYTYKFRENSMLTHKAKDSVRDKCYMRAKISVYNFLNAHNLRRTTRQTNRTWWRLFDIIPLVVVRQNTEHTRNYVRLFGVLPILKTSRRTKAKAWRLV